MSSSAGHSEFARCHSRILGWNDIHQMQVDKKRSNPDEKRKEARKKFPKCSRPPGPKKTGGVESKSKHLETILDDFKSQSPSHFA